MRVSIIKQSNIYDLILPENILGTYWITDVDNNGIDRNLISIEAYENNWKLVSNKDVYYIKDNVFEPYVYLKNNTFYSIRNTMNNNVFVIYCSPTKTEYNYYSINGYLESGFTIGKNESCLINYQYIDDICCTIKKENNKVFIYNNSKSDLYVNNVKIKNNLRLDTGDVIFILGLKLLYLNIKDSSNKKDVYYLGIANNIKVSCKIKNITIPNPDNLEYKEEKEDVEFPLYDESEYFHKMPRFFNPIKELEIKVDAPPEKIENENNSVLLTIGPMFTMSLTSLMTGYIALNGALSGKRSWGNAIPSLVICVAMFASIFIWPLISKKYEKKLKEKKEKERQEKYSNYIESKRQMIIKEKEKQTSILKQYNVSLTECQDIIIKNYSTLWQRRKHDSDFLEVSLGNGSYEMKIKINYPEEHFSMVEDNLKDMVLKLGEEPKMLVDVPVVFSFIKNRISAIIGDQDNISEYTRRLLVQLLAYYSYDELKIIILTDDEKKYQWDFLKMIPHCFTNDKSLRFYGVNNDEYKEVCYYLATIYNTRKEQARSYENNIEDFDLYYLIITDSYSKIKDYDIISSILTDKDNYGFSIFFLDKKITNLPSQCKKFIKLTNSTGELYNIDDISHHLVFTADLGTFMDYEKISKQLSNIPIAFKDTEEGRIPDKVGFLEMYGIGKIEQFNARFRWQTSNPMLNLQAPVGIGKNGETISIDLHEKYHGPHGLIAGMTGSGKSEFIITYILSMALNYHPYEVQFILIDYKGGGLAGAFENSNIGLKLPHLVGAITNLDVNEIKRSLASIESELKRRQSLFNKAREVSNESTIDIYKYQKMYRDKMVDEPVSHLFIICDEFAELKNQQPEFMEQLISTARIGRSLGVHLILATQKPSGVVDPQIWSNSRFRVCMRVQDKSDSNEVIKRNDAAFLKRTGRFYFQVGYNEIFVLGQAAWAGGKYKPSEKVAKTIDTSIDFINNVGYKIKSINTKQKSEIKEVSHGEELINIVKYLSNLAKEENIKCKPLWLEKIPGFIKVENLAQKYNYNKENVKLDIIIGEYDIPSMQEQRLLTLPLTDEGNALIYGASGSGKENFITTLIYSSMLYYSPEEVNYYVMDFGSGMLKMFSNSSMVGNILTIDDEERIDNLFKMISSTIEYRKTLFEEYNGNFVNYCTHSGKTVPAIVVVINNFESYQEAYGEYDDVLNILSRDSSKYGIYFVITVNTPNGIRFKLRQNFPLIYSLQQNSDDDYSTILGNVHKTYPARIFGRGIIKLDNIYEFQTATVTEQEKITKYIKNYCNEYNDKYLVKAKSIPILPKVVGYNEISSEFGKGKGLIIGIYKEDLNICKFDFTKNYTTIVTSLDITSTNDFINCLINQIIVVNNKALIVINAEDFDINEKYKSLYQYVDKKFDDIFLSLYNFINIQNEKYVESNYNRDIFKNRKPIYCIIVGVDNFKNRLHNENKTKFGDLFNKAKDLGIINYILVDSINNIKKIEMEQWYKNAVNNSAGIWIGNGINDQFSIKINQRTEEMKENVPDSFCFVIEKGKAKYVKYVTKLDLDIKKK